MTSGVNGALCQESPNVSVNGQRADILGFQATCRECSACPLACRSGHTPYVKEEAWLGSGLFTRHVEKARLPNAPQSVEPGPTQYVSKQARNEYTTGHNGS